MQYKTTPNYSSTEFYIYIYIYMLFS